MSQTELQKWMSERGMDDAAVAAAVDVHRSSVSRLRRGKSRVKVDTAKRIEALTGISWFSLIDDAPVSG